MPAFVLKLDLADHQHPENLAAQHAKVREWLGLAAQAVGANSSRKGELTIPSFDPRHNIGGHVKIGSWEFVDDDASNEEV